MNRSDAELDEAADELARRLGLSIHPTRLGEGIQGIVFAASGKVELASVAIKIHRQASAFYREVAVYQRLATRGVDSVGGCDVPEMIRYDEPLLGIVMTIVSPPYLLDFAGAWLDQPPDFSEDVLDEWEKNKAERFEEEESRR